MRAGPWRSRAVRVRWEGAMGGARGSRAAQPTIPTAQGVGEVTSAKKWSPIYLTPPMPSQFAQVGYLSKVLRPLSSAVDH